MDCKRSDVNSGSDNRERLIELLRRIKKEEGEQSFLDFVNEVNRIDSDASPVTASVSEEASPSSLTSSSEPACPEPESASAMTHSEYESLPDDVPSDQEAAIPSGDCHFPPSPPKQNGQPGGSTTCHEQRVTAVGHSYCICSQSCRDQSRKDKRLQKKKRKKSKDDDEDKPILLPECWVHLTRLSERVLRNYGICSLSQGPIVEARDISPSADERAEEIPAIPQPDKLAEGSEKSSGRSQSKGSHDQAPRRDEMSASSTHALSLPHDDGSPNASQRKKPRRVSPLRSFTELSKENMPPSPVVNLSRLVMGSSSLVKLGETTFQTEDGRLEGEKQRDTVMDGKKKETEERKSGSESNRPILHDKVEPVLGEMTGEGETMPRMNEMDERKKIHRKKSREEVTVGESSRKEELAKEKKAKSKPGPKSAKRQTSVIDSSERSNEVDGKVPETDSVFLKKESKRKKSKSCDGQSSAPAKNEEAAIQGISLSHVTKDKVNTINKEKQSDSAAKNSSTSLKVRDTGADRTEAKDSGLGRREVKDCDASEKEAKDLGSGRREVKDSDANGKEAKDFGSSRSEVKDSEAKDSESERKNSENNRWAAKDSECGQSEATDSEASGKNVKDSLSSKTRKATDDKKPGPVSRKVNRMKAIASAQNLREESNVNLEGDSLISKQFLSGKRSGAKVGKGTLEKKPILTRNLPFRFLKTKSADLNKNTLKTNERVDVSIFKQDPPKHIKIKKKSETATEGSIRKTECPSSLVDQKGDQEISAQQGQTSSATLSQVGENEIFTSSVQIGYLREEDESSMTSIGAEVHSDITEERESPVEGSDVASSKAVSGASTAKVDTQPIRGNIAQLTSDDKTNAKISDIYIKFKRKPKDREIPPIPNLNLHDSTTEDRRETDLHREDVQSSQEERSDPLGVNVSLPVKNRKRSLNRRVYDMNSSRIDGIVNLRPAERKSKANPDSSKRQLSFDKGENSSTDVEHSKKLETTSGCDSLHEVSHGKVSTCSNDSSSFFFGSSTSSTLRPPPATSSSNSSPPLAAKSSNNSSPPEAATVRSPRKASCSSSSMPSPDPSFKVPKAVAPSKSASSSRKNKVHECTSLNSDDLFRQMVTGKDQGFYSKDYIDANDDLDFEPDNEDDMDAISFYVDANTDSYFQNVLGDEEGENRVGSDDASEGSEGRSLSPLSDRMDNMQDDCEIPVEGECMDNEEFFSGESEDEVEDDLLEGDAAVEVQRSLSEGEIVDQSRMVEGNGEETEDDVVQGRVDDTLVTERVHSVANSVKTVECSASGGEIGDSETAQAVEMVVITKKRKLSTVDDSLEPPAAKRMCTPSPTPLTLNKESDSEALSGHIMSTPQHDLPTERTLGPGLEPATSRKCVTQSTPKRVTGGDHIGVPTSSRGLTKSTPMQTSQAGRNLDPGSRLSTPRQNVDPVTVVNQEIATSRRVLNFEQPPDVGEQRDEIAICTSTSESGGSIDRSPVINTVVSQVVVPASYVDSYRRRQLPSVFTPAPLNEECQPGLSREAGYQESSVFNSTIQFPRENLNRTTTAIRTPPNSNATASHPILMNRTAHIPQEDSNRSALLPRDGTNQLAPWPQERVSRTAATPPKGSNLIVTPALIQKEIVRNASTMKNHPILYEYCSRYLLTGLNGYHCDCDKREGHINVPFATENKKRMFEEEDHETVWDLFLWSTNFKHWFQKEFKLFVGFFKRCSEPIAREYLLMMAEGLWKRDLLDIGDEDYWRPLMQSFRDKIHGMQYISSAFEEILRHLIRHPDEQSSIKFGKLFKIATRAFRSCLQWHFVKNIAYDFGLPREIVSSIIMEISAPGGKSAIVANFVEWLVNRGNPERLSDSELNCLKTAALMKSCPSWWTQKLEDRLRQREILRSSDVGSGALGVSRTNQPVERRVLPAMQSLRMPKAGPLPQFSSLATLQPVNVQSRIKCISEEPSSIQGRSVPRPTSVDAPPGSTVWDDRRVNVPQRSWSRNSNGDVKRLLSPQMPAELPSSSASWIDRHSAVTEGRFSRSSKTDDDITSSAQERLASPPCLASAEDDSRAHGRRLMTTVVRPFPSQESLTSTRQPESSAVCDSDNRQVNDQERGFSRTESSHVERPASVQKSMSPLKSPMAGNATVIHTSQDRSSEEGRRGAKEREEVEETFVKKPTLRKGTKGKLIGKRAVEGKKCARGRRGSDADIRVLVMNNKFGIAASEILNLPHTPESEELISQCLTEGIMHHDDKLAVAKGLVVAFSAKKMTDGSLLLHYPPIRNVIRNLFSWNFKELVEGHDREEAWSVYRYAREKNIDFASVLPETISWRKEQVFVIFLELYVAYCRAEVGRFIMEYLQILCEGKFIDGEKRSIWLRFKELFEDCLVVDSSINVLKQIESGTGAEAKGGMAAWLWNELNNYVNLFILMLLKRGGNTQAFDLYLWAKRKNVGLNQNTVRCLMNSHTDQSVRLRLISTEKEYFAAQAEIPSKRHSFECKKYWTEEEIQFCFEHYLRRFIERTKDVPSYGISLRLDKDAIVPEPNNKEEKKYSVDSIRIDCNDEGRILNVLKTKFDPPFDVKKIGSCIVVPRNLIEKYKEVHGLGKASSFSQRHHNGRPELTSLSGRSSRGFQPNDATMSSWPGSSNASPSNSITYPQSTATVHSKNPIGDNVCSSDLRTGDECAPPPQALHSVASSTNRSRLAETYNNVPFGSAQQDRNVPSRGFWRSGSFNSSTSRGNQHAPSPNFSDELSERYAQYVSNVNVPQEEERNFMPYEDLRRNESYEANTHHPAFMNVGLNVGNMSGPYSVFDRGHTDSDNLANGRERGRGRRFTGPFGSLQQNSFDGMYGDGMPALRSGHHFRGYR